MHVARRLTQAFVTVVALIGAACSQTPNFDNTGGSSSGHGSHTGTSSAQGGSSGTGPKVDCGECSTTAEAKSCKIEFAACDAECQSILKCTMMDPAQVEVCARPFASGLVAFRALASCLCQSCSDSCADCKLLTCLDGMKDGDETAIDCGGSCQACTGNCMDGIKDNGEVGIDCGGPCANKCDVGSACVGNSDCTTGFCVDGVCCADACQGTCVACSAAKKGSGADGTCGAIAAGTDPDSECVSPSGDTCNGTGACQCHDGTKDGTESNVDCGGGCGSCSGTCSDHQQNQGETDVDCGGPNCPACPGGKHCASGTDCTSMVCNGGTCCTPESMGTTCNGKCGTVNNNCGQPVSCGGCTSPDVCGAVTPNKCDCVDPSACSGHCGTITDACGKQQTCPSNCPSGEACNNHVCVCSDPNACNGKCGMVTDMCGKVQSCGGCTAPDTCGGGGPNVCGCVPKNNCGNQCSGTVGDGCSGQWTCTGSQCGGNQTCYSGQCCTPVNNCGAMCSGSTSNNCGGTNQCTAGCGGGQVCYNNNCCTPITQAAACGADCAGQVVSNGCGGSYTCPTSCGTGEECTAAGQCCTPTDGDLCTYLCGSPTDSCGVVHACGSIVCRDDNHCGCSPASCNLTTYECNCNNCSGCVRDTEHPERIICP